jgi:hypothetical protein
VGGVGEAKLSVMNGNVGIGTWVPNKSLCVGTNCLGSIDSSGNGLLNGTLGVTGHVSLEGVTSTGATGTGNLVFSTSPTLVTPALGTPASGVGTYLTGIPEDAFAFTDITTANSSTSQHGLLEKLDNTASHYMDGTGNWSTPAGGGGGTNYWLNDSGNIGINTSYSVGIGTQSQINTLSILGNIGIGSTGNDSYLNTTAPLGGMIAVGDVGIGTWIPQAQLDVENATNQNNILNYGGGNTGIGTITTINKLDVSGNIGIGASYAGLKGAPTNGMIIQGNVGIGTNLPLDNLDIAGGTLRIAEGAGTSFNLSKYYYLNSQVIGSPFTDDRLVLNSSGTTNGTRIWIDGSGTTTGLSMAQGGNEEMFFGAESGAGYINYYGTLNFYNSGTVTNTLSITQAGLMHISGAVSIGTSYMTNTPPSQGLSVQGNVGIGTWVVNNNDRLDIVGGNIGISTTNAASLLTGVNGSGSTSCLCKQYEGGLCVSLGACT